MPDFDHIPLMGSVGALEANVMDSPPNPLMLRVSAHAFSRRYAVVVADNGLESFGLRIGDYAIFREQRWPTHECSVCLVRFGDEVTIRILEYLNNPEVVLRVSAEQIPALELAPTDFSVIGVLDGTIREEFARIVQPMSDTFDWGC